MSVLLIALDGFLCPTGSHAESTPSQALLPLADALEAFAKLHGYQLVYRAELADGLHSGSVSLGLPASEELRQMLRGTHLSFQFINEKTIAIFQSQDDSSSAAAAGPTSPSAKVPQPHARGPALPDPDPVLQEILVSARKRSEQIQEVPVAITVIDAESISRSGSTTVTDLNAVAPSLNLQNFAIIPFSLTAVIRGIGTADFEPSTDPAVALIVDGVPQAATNGAPTGLLDTESVEVLRGPQGTLFGRNATAGALLIQSKRPENVWGFEAQATGGNYGQLDFAGALTGPILEDLLAFGCPSPIETWMATFAMRMAADSAKSIATR